MRVALNNEYIGLNKSLARKSNSLARSFSQKRYLRVNEIKGMLLRRDISVERKKRMLMDELRSSILQAFSVNRGRFGAKSMDSLKKRIQNIRKLLHRLRSINYYLETSFFEELGAANPKRGSAKVPARQSGLARDELEALEYAAYRLIAEAVVLDKKLLSEYSRMEGIAVQKEKSEAKSIEALLAKQTSVMEHLEAKLPPPKALTAGMLQDPKFTHWVSRVFALLSCLEHLYKKEKAAFGRLRKNKSARKLLNRKISGLLTEKSELLRVMQEKSVSMKNFRQESLKREVHNFTTIISL